MLIEFVNINKKVVANLILPQDGAVQFRGTGIVLVCGQWFISSYTGQTY